MPSLREEITKTFLRLTGAAGRRRQNSTGSSWSSAPRASSHPSSLDLGDTVAQTDSREGQQIGVYRILKRLGFGGMGYVYLALDTRLDRQVALKFLPPDLTSNRDLLYRLRKEARTASALNHPNIVTIYEIGEVEGDYFIVSEFVDGITLRTAMERQPTDAGTAIDVASQVTSALLAAHSAGVIHRDLKPGNIMIRPDGYVKVIDFGLAKQIQSSPRNDSGEVSATRPGAVVGTISYMSPEQARGDPVDHRTDLWSVGILLYEMVAHRRPFEGETESHVIVAILDHPIPPLPDLRSLPAGLPRIIQRALAKDPAKRYQSAGELLADLQHISQTSGLGSKIRPVLLTRRPINASKLVASAAVLLVLLFACAVWWWPLGGNTRVLGPNWFRIESVRPLTFNGRATLASLSPDGNYLAFAAGDPSGEQTLYLKQVESSTEEIKIPARRISYAGLVFSPDSKYIFETEKDETLTGKLYAVPLVGSRPAQPIIEDIDGPATFSPSGDRVAFVRYIETGRAGKKQMESAIFVAAPDGSELHKLVSIQNVSLSQYLAWSPRNNQIAAILYSRLPGRSGQALLDLVDLGGHESRRHLPAWRSVGQLCWTPDARSLILSSTARQEGKNQAQLREMELKSGRIYDITKDLAGYNGASLARDGLELAAVKQEAKASLWLSPENDFTNGQTAPAEAEEHPTLAWSDANHLIVNSRRSGFPNLWLFDISTQARIALTNEPHVEQEAAAVPGSDSVIFSSNRDGQFHLWRFDPETNRYTQLTSGPNYDEAPSVSNNGQWIVYTSWTTNDPHLRKVPVRGGTSEQIGTYSASDPQISPDGKWIAARMEDPNTEKWAIAIIPFDGSGEPHRIPDAQLPMRWSPDGAALTSVRTDRKGVSNIWRIPLDDSAPRQLTRFEEESILNFAWSRKGDRLACVHASLGTDVALFKGQKSR